jgi:DNA-binding GntR family transcriptional regulator
MRMTTSTSETTRTTGAGQLGLLGMSRRERIVALLRNQIVTGQRSPGEKLKQDVIASELGVSQGSVREALRSLESEGLARHVPNHGAFVSEFSVEELVDLLLPMRLAIESYAVPLAAPRLASERLPELRDIIRDMADAARVDDFARLNELDVRFHEITVEEAASPQALQLWRSVQPRIRLQFYRLALRHRHAEEIVTEHQQLLDAIVDGDTNALRAELKNHIVDTTLALLDADHEDHA